MSLKDKNGNFSATKITVLCTLIMAFGTLIVAIPVMAGWIGKTVDIARTPDHLATTDQRLYNLETNCEVNFRDIHWELHHLENVITNHTASQ